MNTHTFHRKTKKTFRKIVSNSWVRRFIRFGYFIRGLLYAFIGIFAIGMVLGFEKASVNQRDLIVLASKLPFHDVILSIVLSGIVAYSLWGFIRAALDYLNTDISPMSIFQRLGYIVSGIFYASLSVPTFALLTHKNVASHEQYSVRTFSEYIIHIPFGQLIIGSIGIIIGIAGLVQIMKAIKAKSPEDLNYKDQDTIEHYILMFIARVGIITRGILWFIVGGFIITAAFNADLSKIQGTTDSINTLNTLPMGYVLVALIALGFVLFGLYSISLSFFAALPKYE